MLIIGDLSILIMGDSKLGVGELENSIAYRQTPTLKVNF